MDRASGARGSARRRPARARQPRRIDLKSLLPVVLLAVAALVILGAGSAAAFQATHSGEVYPGIMVGDVQIGGLSKDAAIDKLRPWLGQRASQPLVVRGPGIEKTVSAAELGATFDAAAAVDAAYSVGRTGDPIDRVSAQFHALVGGYQVEAPGLRLDKAKLSAAVAEWAQEIDRPVRDASMKIGSTLTVEVTSSVVGRKLDQAAAVAALEHALATGASSVDLPVTETQPKVVDKDLEDARLKVSKMLSGPVSLEFSGQKWTLSTKDIAAAITIDQMAGTPSPAVTLKDDSLKKLVDTAATAVDQPKINARFDWNGGNLRPLSAGQDGRKVDTTKALALLTSALSSDQRVVQLPVTVDKAVQSNVDPASLGIKEKIISDTTSFYGSVPERAHNIKLAASKLNGVLLAPGDVFSFNNELGPTTLKAGYQLGFGILVQNGQTETVPSVGGGICQVATTLFHNVFWAGYEIDERYPHAYWIRTYGQPPLGMVGLDTTVDPPNLDFQFTNNTNDYLLIQSSSEGSTVTFTLYGTKPTWKVDVAQPVITNVVKPEPGTLIQQEPSWPAGKQVWVDQATDGMDVSIVRKVTDGTNVRTLNVKSHYVAVRNTLAVGPGTVLPTATPTAGPTPTPTPGASTSPAATPAPTAHVAAAPTPPKPQPPAAATAVPSKPSPTPKTH